MNTIISPSKKLLLLELLISYKRHRKKIWK